MIKLFNQEVLAERIAKSLSQPIGSACWQVVMPPGLANENDFAEEILGALRKLEPARNIACVHADVFYDRDEYARTLALSWGMDIDVDAPNALQNVLGRLTEAKPGVQILAHFHKIVSNLDAQVLGDLRAAEQGPACRLRTVTLTSLPYSELKERWRREGVAFSVSDYGDTHHELRPMPLERDGLQLLLAALEMPQKLIDFALRLTGGYPAPLEALVARWELEGRPHLKPEVRALLRRTVEQRLDRFTSWLDRPGEFRFCSYVCDLHHGLDVENARIQLSLHPWQHVILAPQGLRAEAVGTSAATRLARLAQDAPDDGPRRDLWRRGRELYRMGRFAEVASLTDAAPGLSLRPHLRLLSIHAQIMAELTGGANESSPADADWKRLTLLLEEARAVATPMSDRDILESRYVELLTPSRHVVQALAAGPRPVDILAGLRGSSASPESAAFFLTLCLQGGRRIAGPSAAMKLVFELPEQIFRCWAFVALGINYYEVPDYGDEVWALADTEWTTRRERRSALGRSEVGKEFSSFSAFAFFALSHYRQQNRPAELAPEPDFAALDRSLSHFDKRKDFAHAVATANEKERTNYFQLIERWLDAFCAACPGGLTRAVLAARTDPLPLVAEDGALLG